MTQNKKKDLLKKKISKILKKNYLFYKLKRVKED